MADYLSIGTFVKRLILKNQLEVLTNSPVRYVIPIRLPGTIFEGN
jgi:hypothetical protein